MFLNYPVKWQQLTFPAKIIQPYNVIFLLFVIIVIYYVFKKYDEYQIEQSQSLAIISNPKINDIYFLDFRKISDDLRPKEKYRIAKVVDITGNIVTLLYGTLYFNHQRAAINSIKYGQLSYRNYFEPKRYDLPLKTIENMYHNGAIYLAKRPIRNKLFGNVVGPHKLKLPEVLFIYGKNENKKGEAFLKDEFNETSLKTAFELFHISSKLDYAKGQVNLAEMYINGWHVEKDFNKALYWLKKASMQSSKSAILKYGIICKKIETCSVLDFYQELSKAGVSIKVREVDFKLN